MRRFDVLVVGSGSAGTAAALGCRKAGRSVAVAEARELGGTCMLRGCDPKKVLVEAARVADGLLRYKRLGIFDSVPQLDWAALQRFKRTFTQPAPAERQRTYEQAGIEILHGKARCVEEHRVAVDSETIEATTIVIATGAHPKSVAPGSELLLTSEAFLDLETLPASLLFIGGGYIAFEFAHVAVRAGARVTILNDGTHVLGGFDPVLSDRLCAFSESLGITIERNTRVERIVPSEGGITVHATRNDMPATFAAQAGVLAAGRAPDLDELGPERIGVARTQRGVTVNRFLQSTTSAYVYAAGDAADDGGKPLTPVADAQGEVVAKNVVHGNGTEFDARGLASIVYTIPPLATVGLSEREARDLGIDVAVHEGDMGAWYSTRSTASDVGYYRTFTDRSQNRIVGASVLGPHAEGQINLIAAAIAGDIAPDALSRMLFAYPTGASDISYLIGAS